MLRKYEEMDVEKKKFESSKRSFQITKALVNAGRLAGIELARAQVRYDKDVRSLQNKETELQQTVNEALIFASMKLDTKVKFTTKLAYNPLKLDLEKLTDYALRHRPDYLSAQRNLDLANLSLKETLEANNPKINLTASMSKTVSDTNLAESTSKGISGGVNLTWALFDARITDLQAKNVRNSIKDQEMKLKTLERTIRKEVQNAYLDVQRTELQFDDLKFSREQARQNVEAVRIRYQNGRDRLVDVFDSERELEALEKDYLDLIIQTYQLRDNFPIIIGGTLEEALR